MASREQYRRPLSPQDDLDFEDIQGEATGRPRTRERLQKVQEQIRELELHKDRETSSQTREQLDKAERRLAQLQRGETSSATRDELAKMEAAIAREQDSATIVNEPLSPERLSSRDRIHESQEKLKLIQTRKAEINQLLESLKRSQTVDLCFLIDCTDSMQSYLNEVVDKIQTLVTKCRATFPDLILNLAFVGYRDHYDDERIEYLQFTRELSEFKSFVATVKASGGDDAAEDVFGGLEQVTELRWSAPTRVLLHVADAPCHGSKFHDRVEDKFLNGDPRGLRAEDLLHRLEELRVKYWFVKINDSTDKMVQVFRRLLKNQDMLQQVTLNAIEELMPVVAESVSTSIREMESVTIADAAIEAYSKEYVMAAGEENPNHQITRAVKPRSLKTFRLCENIPNWNNIQDEKAYVFRYKLPTTLNALQTQLKEEKRKSKKLKVAPQPFAQGTQRIVYFGIDCTYSPSKKVVFKEFKYLGKGLNKLESYKKQMEIQTISSFLAQEFNRQKPLGAKDILFTKVVVISLHERSKPFYCSQEPLIEGRYVKYNSNCGYVNQDVYTASLNAFSHWTYQVTDGYLMVVDLQGVQIMSEAGPKYTLTDPALHCKDLARFSSTNLGKDGMHRFFRTHHCNTICKAMRLEPHRHQPQSSSGSTVVQSTVVHH